MAYLGRQPNTGVRSRYIFTATASQTTFSGSDDDGKTLKYEDAAYLDVFLNGVLLKPVTDYAATTKTSVVLTSGAAVSDIVEIVAYDIANIADTVSKANGGTFDAGVTVNGTVTADGLAVDTNTLYVDSTNNRVGVGTTTPSHLVEVTGESNNTSKVSSTSGYSQLLLDGTASVNYITNIGNSTTADTSFYVGGAERARITSDGNLLVGKTTANFANAGQEFRPTSYSAFTRDGGTTALFNRKTSDGTLVEFMKDGTTVGTIGAYFGGTYIGSPVGSDAYLMFESNVVRPAGQDGSNRDNVIDMGKTTSRFDDIYATNGTIQTSDANEKQQIASLTDAEITAAKAISKLFKTFKWNDKVEAKGDAARNHTGVIAQEVEQAMTDAGLDAGNYAFFISSTWWETQTEVPAVEADEENGIEAKEAYTRTDTYDTAEEAPADAVERTRLGIRYPELLSFIGAATEQRLASIESRLDALENV